MQLQNVIFSSKIKKATRNFPASICCNPISQVANVLQRQNAIYATIALGTFFRSIRFNIVQWRANQAELPSPWCAFSGGKMRVGRIWQLTAPHNFSHHDTGLFQTHNFFHWQIRVKWILKMHVSIFKSLYIFWGNFTFLRSKTAPITNPLYKTWWPF